MGILSIDLSYAEVASPPVITPAPSISTLQNSQIEPQISNVVIRFKKKPDYIAFTEWINSRPYSVYLDQMKSKEQLREEWKQALGGRDIFYLYFKARDIKVNIENKTSFSVLKIRGKAEIAENEIRYVFRLKF